ncbi:DMT family transporter [Vibrio mexicanus]|uniref:DMT family transporter n=1 Tax=Vibrio mexicanus TaxID=1004326 RepID=UPI00063CA165|nr:DMT family transporter [Vibrio mexicanus]
MNSDRKATIILVIATLLAALGWVFSKESIQGLPPFGFIGSRFLIASICLLPFCYSSLKKAKWKDLASSSLVGVLLAGAILNWIYAISISETLGEGAFIVSLSMLIVPLVGWALYRVRPTRAFWISLPFAVIGLALLSLSGGWQVSVSQLAFLGCATMLAIHFNVNSLYSQKLPTLLLTCVQLFTVGCIALLVSWLFEEVPSQIDSSIWVWFAMSVLLATTLRYVMQTLGQKYTSSANAALVMILEPVWTVVLSVLWYGEQLSTLKMVGCVLILFSLVVYRTQGRFKLFNNGRTNNHQ